MQFGLALDFGSREDLGGQLLRAATVLSAAEAAGLDSVWVGESYHERPAAFHLPAPLVLLAHLGAMTALGLGTGVLLLRAYDPHRLAFEAALLDQLTRGRLTLGVGLGDPWVSARLNTGRLEQGFFDRGLALLKDAWVESEAPSEAWSVMPRPYRPGGPQILVGGHGDRALERAVSQGDGYFAATQYSDSLLRLRARQYRGRRGEGDGEVCVTRICVIRETAAAAATARDRFAGVTDFYRRNGVWGLGPDGVADPSAGAELVGTPREVAARLDEYASWGVSRVNLRIAPLGVPAEEAAETVRLLGDELGLVAAGASPQSPSSDAPIQVDGSEPPTETS